MIETHSLIYYGFNITTDNNMIDFSEGGPELTATIPVGEYTLTEIADEVSAALNVAGALTYTVTVNRATRVISIAAGANFELRVTTGTHVTSSAFGVIGFAGADRTGASSYPGVAAGSSYYTQFMLQDFVSSEDFRRTTEATINKSASGKIEVVSFGEEKFLEFNIRYVTDIPFSGVIRNNASGVANLRSLMRHLITKAPVEFIPDEATPAVFEKLILESTPDDGKGVGYKLRELYGQGLKGFYETGTLKLRVVE